MKKWLYPLVLAALLAVGLTGCRIGSETLAESVTIKVAATQDFGREIIFQREAVINSRLSAQDVLALVTDFETDGSYILEFEGLCGNDQVYWMYYINGLLSKWFAGGYIIRPGDVMHWDFHPWAGAHHGSSAIIGSFPEPLLHGFEGQTRPTSVVYGEGFREEAEAIAAGLVDLGVASVTVVSEANLTTDDQGYNNIVLLASSESPLIADLNAIADPLGMYAFFEDGELKITDYLFQTQQGYGAGTGVIQACQNPWNPLGTGACSNAVFMVSGVDNAGAMRAIQLLLDSIEAIKDGEAPPIEYAFGVIITPEGEVVRTPL